MRTNKSKNTGVNVKQHRPACVFFMRGICRKGNKCSFEHSIEASSQTLEVCKYHMTNSCRYGEYCQLPHGLACPHCKLNAIHPSNSSWADEHTKACEQRQKILDSLPEELIEKSHKIECGICLEPIKTSAQTKFGLMSGCDHAFCVQCINQWRAADSISSFSSNSSQDMTKTCPTCRASSLFVIPSIVYVTGDLKNKVVEQYKASLKTKPCKYYDKSSSCPFGSDCFYAHLNSDGTIADTSKMKNLIKNKRSVADYSDGDYELDEDIITRLARLDPSYVMTLLMNMLADDEHQDWGDIFET
eukprot:TRINITY_DN1425_c0_g1_i1.p1 TRINITY_DN1425_c0_g1~~TRINITY_DN1425_c0_g1_i1.p1  ORF type:complete len:301 (-),score=49.86 TRINITY_DN1425_c0_g1_i1:2-904(-)